LSRTWGTVTLSEALQQNAKHEASSNIQLLQFIVAVVGFRTKGDAVFGITARIT
jgi:hypothetical protein